MIKQTDTMLKMKKNKILSAEQIQSILSYQVYGVAIP
jgi:hypothetical protein